MAKQFTLTNEATAIKKQIKSISTRGAAWQNDVQICAINIIGHVSIHHEVSLINNLIDALPKGARVNAMRTFMETYAKAVYCEDSKQFLPVKDEKYTVPETLENWYDLKPEPEYKPFDLNAKIQALIKNAVKAQKKANKEDKIDPEVIAALRTMVEA